MICIELSTDGGLLLHNKYLCPKDIGLIFLIEIGIKHLFDFMHGLIER